MLLHLSTDNQHHTVQMWRSVSDAFHLMPLSGGNSVKTLHQACTGKQERIIRHSHNNHHSTLRYMLPACPSPCSLSHMQWWDGTWTTASLLGRLRCSRSQSLNPPSPSPPPLHIMTKSLSCAMVPGARLRYPLKTYPALWQHIEASECSKLIPGQVHPCWDRCAAPGASH